MPHFRTVLCNSPCVLLHGAWCAVLRNQGQCKGRHSLVPPAAFQAAPPNAVAQQVAARNLLHACEAVLRAHACTWQTSDNAPGCTHTALLHEHSDGAGACHSSPVPVLSVAAVGQHAAAPTAPQPQPPPGRSRIWPQAPAQSRRSHEAAPRRPRHSGTHRGCAAAWGAWGNCWFAGGMRNAVLGVDAYEEGSCKVPRCLASNLN